MTATTAQTTQTVANGTDQGKPVTLYSHCPTCGYPYPQPRKVQYCRTPAACAKRVADQAAGKAAGKAHRVPQVRASQARPAGWAAQAAAPATPARKPRASRKASTAKAAA